MKALTLRHPWPFAICHMGKRIENRTWRPSPAALKWGERFAIHGGAVPTSPARLSEVRSMFNQIVWQHGPPSYRVNRDLTLAGVIMPGIVATAVLSEVVSQSDDPWFDGSGYGWVLTDVIVLPKPIPCKGAQGLWDVPEAIISELLGATS